VEQIYWRTVQPLVGDLRKEWDSPRCPPCSAPSGGCTGDANRCCWAGANTSSPAARARRRGCPRPDTGFSTTIGLATAGGAAAVPGLRRTPGLLGLGSMSGIESARTRRIATLTAEALKRAGSRGVLLSNHGSIDGAGLPDGIVGWPARCPTIGSPAGRSGRAPRRGRHGGRRPEGWRAVRGDPPSAGPGVLGPGGWPPWASVLPPSPRNNSPPNASPRPSYRPRPTPGCAAAAAPEEKISAEDGIGRAVEGFELHVRGGARARAIVRALRSLRRGGHGA
jgi:hypothetical protein